MKPISLALLALCLCLTGCEKKPEPKTNVGKPEPKTNIGKPEPKTNIGKPGTVLWEFETGRHVVASPAIGSDGTVYVGSWDKKLYALSGKSGDKLWEFETGDRVRSSPAIGPDGTVYVGSNKLYAIKTDSKGPAESPWPMFGQNAQHTGRVMKK